MAAKTSGMVDENLSSQVEIFLGCRNLPRMDYFSKTDAKVFLYLKDRRSNVEVLLGSTETVQNSHNPDFQTTFIVEYFFEENQKLIARVFDADDDRQQFQVTGRNYIGAGEFTIGDIVGSKGSEVLINLKNLQDADITNFTGVQFAQILARCDEVSGVNEVATITLTGMDLDPYQTFCCSNVSNPFFEIYKKRSAFGPNDVASWAKTYTSDTVYGTVNPRFLTFPIRKQSLCNSDNKHELMFKVWHRPHLNQPKLIGQGKTTFKQMLKMVESHEEARKVLKKSKEKLNLRGMLLPLVNPAIAVAKGRRYKNSGVLLFNRISEQTEASFLDYVQGGLNLKLMVAIDFTASNGEPKDPSSNHYIDIITHTRNKYEKAIEAIGCILVPYDSDQMIPEYDDLGGFGAKLVETGQVSHCFPLTFNKDEDEVKGVDGILQVYQQCFSRIDLAGPTLLSDVLLKADQICSMPFTQTTQHYSVLLILTDGVINDMKATIHRICKASSKPISIIIIGIGDADFGDMKILDADADDLESKRLAASRDIVQFVAMNQFRDSDLNRLSSEVLQEIPSQLLGFMRSRKVQPMMRRKKQATTLVTSHGGIMKAAMEARADKSAIISLPGQTEPMTPDNMPIIEEAGADKEKYAPISDDEDE